MWLERYLVTLHPASSRGAVVVGSSPLQLLAELRRTGEVCNMENPDSRDTKELGFLWCDQSKPGSTLSLHLMGLLLTPIIPTPSITATVFFQVFLLYFCIPAVL